MDLLEFSDQYINRVPESTQSIPKDQRPKCPACKTNDQVVPIVYGLIDCMDPNWNDSVEVDSTSAYEKYRDVDDNDFFYGGDVLQNNMPSWYCKKDKTKFSV